MISPKRGAYFYGAQGQPLPKQKKSPDLTHYFFPKGPFLPKKIKKNKNWTSRGPSLYGAQGDLPAKPENSPDLTHYFSEGVRFNKI